LGHGDGFPLVWDSDVKDWIDERRKAKRLRVLNLATTRHKPTWGENHIVEFLK
jgi:hypothetical protein